MDDMELDTSAGVVANSVASAQLRHSGEVQRIAVSELHPAPWNARRYFDEVTLADLGKSLLESGQLQPVLVRQVDGHYELIAGERRYRAAKKVGITHLDARVIDADDRNARRMGLAENLDREDLNAWDEMEGVLRFIAFELSQISSNWTTLVERHGGEVEAAAHIVQISARPYRLQHHPPCRHLGCWRPSRL